MSMFLQIVMALLLDRLLGEPRRWHPLVGFGRLASALECRLHGGDRVPPSRQRWRGLLAWSLAVLPWVALAFYLSRLPAPWSVGFSIGLLWLALGLRSLVEHGRAVARSLRDATLTDARRQVARMVSRDTRALDRSAVSRAAIESVLENGNDAVFGAIFWFVLLGAPGVVLYRLANTLDAMWGYRNARYRDFGFFAARIDDLLNWLPARLTALAYLLAGNLRSAWRSWRVQAPAWEGWNPGVVMAAGAGALGLRLGGVASYHGESRERPWLGEGREAEPADIERSLGLIRRAVGLWLLVLLLGAVFHA